jgi:magnesium-transporting ATPase (P-type)
VVAVLITLIGAALLKQQVFAPIQMLWINLIMDTLASLALATEAPTEDLLERQPNRRQEHIVSRNMGKHILGQAALQIVIIIILIFWGENIIP